MCFTIFLTGKADGLRLAPEVTKMKIAITYDTDMPDSQMSVVSGLTKKFIEDPRGLFLEHKDPDTDASFEIRRGSVAVIHDDLGVVHEYEVAAILHEGKWNVMMQYMGEKAATEEQLSSDNLSVHDV